MDDRTCNDYVGRIDESKHVPLPTTLARIVSALGHVKRAEHCPEE
jgi:hypothetical protein